MRDESKAAAAGTLLLLLLALLAFFHPDTPVVHRHPAIPPTDEIPEDPLPPGRFDEFIARYGPPTFEEQSDKGFLHPPLFTKWLDYEPEHLRVAFVAAESPSELHSRSWVLIAFLDSSTPVSPREAAHRLRTRSGRPALSTSP